MKKTIAALTILAAMMLSLNGCGTARPAGGEAPTAEPQVTADAQTPAENEGQAAPSGTGRQDGERFEAVIILEGMEEPVQYEHIINKAAGFEMDFEYENLVRRGEAERERFISIWDDPDKPENYLEVTYSAADAETVAVSVSALLSQKYDLLTATRTLESAGECIRIEASEIKGTGRMADQLQAVYIIPAADGCRVATAHYSIESAEGFAKRFAYMLNTLSLIDGNGGRPLSDGQALSAIRNYCLIGNPELGSETAGEYPVYWEVSSSTDSEIVVVFRSYTGSINRYYIDPVSGETYVTEFVPGIIEDEQRTDESLNAWDYAF